MSERNVQIKYLESFVLPSPCPFCGRKIIARVIDMDGREVQFKVDAWCSEFCGMGFTSRRFSSTQNSAKESFLKIWERQSWAKTI